MYGLMLIICLFLWVLALFSTILLVNSVSEVSVYSRFNHAGQTCCFRVKVYCFNGSKEFLHCGLKFNDELVSLWLVFKFSKIYFKISHVVLKVCYF